jgi:two-component system, cell cycle sensor histidine kinase and response regulator CckA
MREKGSPQVTILLVEDDSSVRHLVETILSKAGCYTLLSAQNAREALKISGAHPGPIDLLLTDVTMPGMNGVTLCREIARDRPDTTLLLISGHADVDTADLPLLRKPFTPELLLFRIRQLLKLQIAIGRAAGTIHESV